ncbi:MAG: TPM domain-containing protein [Vulcanimicrobiaceae bacterium]
MIQAFVLGWILAVIPPAPTHYVTDNANVLSSATRQSLETELHDFDTKTHRQVIVWIGQSTDGQPLETWTVNAAEKWRVGKKGKDNGAVLFVFMRDHRVRIEVGYGLEGTLTDATSANIISDTITPAMRKGDTDAAITGGVDAMLTAIDPSFVSANKKAPAISSDTSSSDDTMGAIVFVLLALIIGGGLIVAVIVTIARHGKRHGDWLDAFMFVNPPGSGGGGGFFGGGFGGGGGGGGGFSGGGGGFGGGGASGSW